ncbi:hypothetical protein H6F67_13325 [Microcoleus sp. FACHB-1515]|uniref:hypothetical protein n=1 Tax=Cyanophyceae TaxID=3028117 RepID=UPI0016874253|nr:hypothetical protein [Microcoleus sp. FACHB-1515]MBD2090831.1 hypothetical protein [Microcoleus sp. FACHB-1515]
MDGGNTFRQAKFLGTAVLGNGNSPSVQIGDTIEGRERAEWYRFRIRGSSSLPTTPLLIFAGGEFVPRMEVFQAAGNRPGKRIARLDTVNSSVRRSLPQGTFFIKISGTPAPANSGQFATFAASISLFG